MTAHFPKFMEISEEDFSSGSWESLPGDEPKAGAEVYPSSFVPKESFVSLPLSQQAQGEKEKRLMTREEQEARNEATEARVESMMEKMRADHNEAIGEIKSLKSTIERDFEKQSAERETFRAELRGDMKEVKESNKWASRFVTVGVTIIAVLAALLALAFSKGVGLF